jgi:secreted trypsin-like serine protease
MNNCLGVLMVLISLAILPGIIQALNLADVPCGNLASSTRRIHQRIMGGAVAEIEDFPYAVSMKRYGKHYCGGSLVSQVF